MSILEKRRKNRKTIEISKKRVSIILFFCFGGLICKNKQWFTENNIENKKMHKFKKNKKKHILNDKYKLSHFCSTLLSFALFPPKGLLTSILNKCLKPRFLPIDFSISSGYIYIFVFSVVGGKVTFLFIELFTCLQQLLD